MSERGRKKQNEAFYVQIAKAVLRQTQDPRTLRIKARSSRTANSPEHPEMPERASQLMAAAAGRIT